MKETVETVFGDIEKTGRVFKCIGTREKVIEGWADAFEKGGHYPELEPKDPEDRGFEFMKSLLHLAGKKIPNVGDVHRCRWADADQFLEIHDVEAYKIRRNGEILQTVILPLTKKNGRFRYEGDDFGDWNFKWQSPKETTLGKYLSIYGERFYIELYK